jgi:hypothetical protein
VIPFDKAMLKAEIVSRLNQWRDMIRRNPAEARTLLARLLGNQRLRFEPVQDAQGKRYVFSGQAALSGFFEGALARNRPDSLVTPGGRRERWEFALTGEATA